MLLFLKFLKDFYAAAYEMNVFYLVSLLFYPVAYCSCFLVVHFFSSLAWGHLEWNLRLNFWIQNMCSVAELHPLPTILMLCFLKNFSTVLYT